MQLENASPAQLREWASELEDQYQHFQALGLKLDLTRGKPGAEQLALSDALDGILQGNYRDGDGTDVRNYGGLDGIASARALFAPLIGVREDEIMVAGNSSLTLMYQAVQFALHNGVAGPDSAWSKAGDEVVFLAPVPGYDRHFAVCEHLGIKLQPVAMTEEGPDMDAVEAAVTANPMIKGIWCVPRFSNPSGIVYSDTVLERLAQLGKRAGPHFRIFFDNAYAVHALDEDAPQLASLMELCRAAGTADSVYIFGSTSKITFAGAGVAFIGASKANLAEFRKHLGFSQIGPDKVNQLRHVRFLKDRAGIEALMRRHAALLRPRFEAVLSALRGELEGLGRWTEPRGGYFVSFDTLPGLAREVVSMAAAAGVSLTPAGATFPYGQDPDDSNIRLAPSFASVGDITRAMEVFVVCVKLASVRQALARKG